MTPANDHIKDQILESALFDVPFDGWTDAVLKNAAVKCGFAPEMAVSVFPSGVKSALDYFADRADRRMLDALGEVDTGSLRVRERIALQNDEHPREVIRTMLGREYVDAHAQGRTPEQFGRSFTTAYPATRVDFVLLSLEAAPLLRSCEVFTPEMAKYASDHFPVVAELAV